MEKAGVEYYSIGRKSINSKILEQNITKTFDSQNKKD